MTTLTKGDTITIQGTSYCVSDLCETGELASSELGILQQVIIEGKRGATYLLQVFRSGELRAISRTGRVISQLP